MNLNLNRNKIWTYSSTWALALAGWAMFASMSSNEALVYALGSMVALALPAFLYFIWIDNKIASGQMLKFHFENREVKVNDNVRAPNDFILADVDGKNGNVLGRMIYKQMHPNKEIEPARRSHPDWITKLP